MGRGGGCHAQLLPREAVTAPGWPAAGMGVSALPQQQRVAGGILVCFVMFSAALFGVSSIPLPNVRFNRSSGICQDGNTIKMQSVIASDHMWSSAGPGTAFLRGNEGFPWMHFALPGLGSPPALGSNSPGGAVLLLLLAARCSKRPVVAWGKYLQPVVSNDLCVFP